MITLSEKYYDIKKLLVATFLQCLLGVFGKSKFEDYWKIVSPGLTEEKTIKINILNFQRGHQYESKALTYFIKEVKCNDKKIAIFYAKNSISSVSPDGLISSDLLIKIKTRAAGSAGPLQDFRI